VHSTYSDGTATVPEIVEAARSNRIDVVLLTDHDSLAARRDGWEGWHGSVLLLVGHEISPRGGHFLAFGLEDEVDHRGRSEEEICEAVQSAGGFGFAAHPFSQGSRMSTTIGRPHPWAALDACASAGIELWSLTTDAAEGWRTPREAIRFLRNPRQALAGPSPRALGEWDRLSATRRVPALGGLDAHQPGLRVRGRVISPMPHERYFGLMHTHLLCRPLTGELGQDRDRVYDALREGRAYLAVDAFGPATGFRFCASREGRHVGMGAAAVAGAWTLHVRLPRPARIRLVRDGVTLTEAESDSLDHPVDAPGVYRVEARLVQDERERVWIVSNPIYLREGN
jgi:hypothetical protein